MEKVGIGEEDRQARVAEIKRKAEQDRKARQNIQREREADQVYRSARSAGPQNPSPATAAPRSSVGAPKQHQRCAVQLCLPSGERQREEFSSEAKLADVHAKARALLERDGITEEFDLICPPRKVITEDDLGLTLLEADCAGVSFIVRPKSSEGVVTTSLAVGTDFEQAFVAEVRWMLREDGLLAWEAEAWVSHVEGQLRRGEMHPLRAGIKALFGGRPLPQVVRGWMQRIEKAPRPQGAPIPKEPGARMLYEFQTLTENERDALGFSMEGGKGGHILRVTMTKLPPESALARDLASVECASATVVLEIMIGSNFPFQAPSIRIISPPLKPLPESSAQQMSRRASVAMEGGEQACGLEGGKAASWSMHWAASVFRLLSWSRNWIVGSAARLDTAAVGQGRRWNSPPSAGSLWQEFVFQQHDEGPEKDDDASWDIDLPPSARMLMRKDKGDDMEVCGQDAGSNTDVMEVEKRGLVDQGFVEVAFRKRRVMCARLRFNAPEGSMRMSPSLLARRFPDLCDAGDQGGRAVAVRSVAFGPALEVVYSATSPAHVNLLRHNSADVAGAIRQACPCCQAGDKVDLFVGGRSVEVLFMSVQGETSCCIITDETRFAFQHVAL